MRIAIEGCAHGQLDQIYESISKLEKEHEDPEFKIDLLLVCGDFQAMRNTTDLECLACPAKYRSMNSFHKYYSGEKKAPVLTIFIGGNHEASNYLQELHFGGWVAPNIFYLGCAGSVKFGGVRIAGLSGIYNQRHFNDGHWERPPYTPNSLRSVYHLRELEVFKMCMLHRILASTPMPIVDIFLSHDWPQGITRYGDEPTLLRKKRFLVQEVQTNTLGSPPAWYLLNLIRPAYWFSAHMHVKFAAVVPHVVDQAVAVPQSVSTEQDTRDSSTSSSQASGTQAGGLSRQSKGNDAMVRSPIERNTNHQKVDSGQASNVADSAPNKDVDSKPPEPVVLEHAMHIGNDTISTETPPVQQMNPIKCHTTRFLALDKCLPRRQYLQVIHIDRRDGKPEGDRLQLEFDPEWLVVLKATNHLNVAHNTQPKLPMVTEFDDSIDRCREDIENRASARTPSEDMKWAIDPTFHATATLHVPNQPPAIPVQEGHPFTDSLLDLLDVKHTGVTVPWNPKKSEEELPVDDNEIDIDDL